MKGSLAIVGSGIKLVGHVTLEAKAHIEQADLVLYTVNESVTAQWIHRLNDNARSLHTLYGRDKPRRQTYEEMVEAILQEVRDGQRVCVVFYGHPGVFVNPGTRAIAQARAEGYRATMTPGVSAQDCLYADLNLDPAEHGCQSYEATDFLLRPRRFDPGVPLILWQVGVVGHTGLPGKEPHRPGLRVLGQVLREAYGAAHEIVLYEAAIYPVTEATILRVPLHELAEAAFSPIATLYVPPKETLDVDKAMLKRLGMSTEQVRRR